MRVVFNGPDALKALSTHKPAVVLMDIGMPDMDGHEVGASDTATVGIAEDVTLIAL